MNNQELLNIELIEYERNVVLTDEERASLREWVASGHSVHENASNAEDGHGNYLDFIDVYRYEKEIDDELEGMTEREQEAFINIYYKNQDDEMPHPMSRKAYLETELRRLQEELASYKNFIQYKHLEKAFADYKEPMFRYLEHSGFSKGFLEKEDLPFKEDLQQWRENNE